MKYPLRPIPTAPPPLRTPRVRTAIPLLVLVFFLHGTGFRAKADSAGPALTPSHKAKILMAGLSLSRGLPAATKSEVKMLLAGDCETADAFASFQGKMLNGIAVTFKRVSAAEVVASVEAEKPAILFACSEARKHLAEISTLAEKLKVVTICDDVVDLKQGLMFGVEVRGERAGLVLNMPQAKAIGLEFDPRLYAVTRVIQ